MIDREFAALKVMELASRFARGLEARIRDENPGRNPLSVTARPLRPLSSVEEEDWSIAAAEVTSWLRTLDDGVPPPIGAAGVYAQFGSDGVFYVGQSQRVSDRLRAYSRRGVQIVTLRTKLSERLYVERDLLDVLLPPGNSDRRTRALRAWRLRSANARQR